MLKLPTYCHSTRRWEHKGDDSELVPVIVILQEDGNNKGDDSELVPQLTVEDKVIIVANR